MEITVDGGTAPEIIIHPVSREEEIVQNVRMILATVQGTVPLHREFGLDSSIIDRPIERARAMIVKEIFEQLHRYEPRAEIIRAGFIDGANSGLDGTLRPQVVLRLIEEEY